jgi:hypothetical protein
MNTKRTAIFLSLAAGAMILGGCSGIRVVKASRSGGEIALLGNREDAMEKARMEMARTCGGPDQFDVVEEGEVVVGQVESTNSSAWGGRHYASGHSTTETSNKTEWRVKYACKGAAQPPPPAAPAAPPPGGDQGAPPPAPQGRIIHEVRVRF